MFPVFLDTNAVYGAAMCDLLLNLAEQGTYRPLWSKGVLDELRTSLGRAGIAPDAVEHRIESISEAFPDAEILGYENLIPQMECDESDRHVLAAAVRGAASVDPTAQSVNQSPSSAMISVADVWSGSATLSSPWRTNDRTRNAMAKATHDHRNRMR